MLMSTRSCLNILKPFPMPQNNFGLFTISWSILLLLTMISSTLFAVSVHATPPIDEIRTIIANKALRPQSNESLSALNTKNLDASLLAMDQYARYVPSSVPSRNSAHPVYLGIEAFIYKSRLWIRTDPSGPAFQTGIPEIGELISINSEKIYGDDLDRISAKLDKAVKEGHVTLTVVSRSGGKGKSYRVKPVAFQPSSITWQRVGADIVMRISEFVSHDTAPGLSARYTALVHAGNRVVLDLRGCSGGDLYEALEIAGMFVPPGLPLASTYDRSGTGQTYRSPPGSKLTSPVWVLIDHRTASAAEILAGILQHHHLARVVGERSYGKCVSQTLFPLSDHGGLWLTTLGINFPDNKTCSGKGITPDFPYPDISVTKIVNIVNKIATGALSSH